MQTTMRSPAHAGSPLIANLLGVGIAGLVLATLSNTSIPLLDSDRAVFIALIILGMVMCTLGGVGRAPAMYGWANPVTLFGIVVGTVMLVLAAAALTGQVADRLAIEVLAGLLAIKWAVGLVFLR
jgi:hypothetical protein